MTTKKTHKCSPIIYSGLVTIIVFLFSAFLWQQFKEQEKTITRALVSEEIEVTTQKISDNINKTVIALQRMAQRWETTNGTPREQWLADARNYVEDFSVLTAVEWADNTFHIRWIEPLAGNEAALDLNIIFNEDRKQALEGAAKENIITLTPPLFLVQGYRAIIAYIPIYTSGKFDGFIIGILNIDALLQSVKTETYKQNFNVQIEDDSLLVFENTENSILNDEFLTENQLPYFNRNWTIKISPTEHFIARQRSFLTEFSLLGGLLISLLSGFAVYVAIISNHRNHLLKINTRELKENEERINLILNNAGEGVFGLNIQGHTTFANKAAVAILGYKIEEMINVSQHDLIHHTLPNGTPYKKEDCNIYAAFKDGKIHTEDKECFWHKDGHAIPVEYTSAPLYDGNGILKGAVVVFKDITERKEYEDALKQANAELEEFAYRTSHDLRSPLVSSISLLNITKESIEHDDVDKVTALKTINLAQSSLKKLEILIQDILMLTQTKNMEEEEKEIDIETLVNDTFEKMSHMDNFNRLEIQKDIQFKDKLLLKESRLVMIVENLISNAIKYQDLDKEKSFINISTKKIDGHFIFTVKDNGLGIPENQKQNLFSMFKRFHTKVSFGSGLGLYMIKKSADILGGNLTHEDSDIGATFIFKLKLKK